MIDKIKQLVESSNYEDNRIALYLIAREYTKKELLDMRDEEGYIEAFGTTTDLYPNGIYVEDEDYTLYHSSPKNLIVTIPGERNYENTMRYIKDDMDTSFEIIKRKE